MWQFWIDVGGTFTDCLAQSPDGQMHQTKVLSSGVFKGQMRLSDLADAKQSADSNDSPGMWDGVQLSLLNAEGEAVFTASVLSSKAGKFKLDRPIPAEISDANATVAYELNAELHAPLVIKRGLICLSWRSVNRNRCSKHRLRSTSVFSPTGRSSLSRTSQKFDSS